MKERHLREEHLLVCQNTQGFLGVMSDFVRYPDKIKTIVLNQLGHVIVADTLENASLLSKATYARYKIVTLAGEVINVEVLNNLHHF